VCALVLNVLTAQSLGLLLGAAVMNPKTAQTIASVIMLAFMLVGGYYVRVSGLDVFGLVGVPGASGGVSVYVSLYTTLHIEQRQQTQHRRCVWGGGGMWMC
jgi:hypothetical protein